MAAVLWASNVAAPHPTFSPPVELTHSSSKDDVDPASVYLREIGTIPLLKPEAELNLAQAIERGKEARTELAEGNPGPVHTAQLQDLIRQGAEARQQLLEANLRLVVSLARRRVGRGLLLADLIQEGNLGLARAIEKYDYRLGFRFSTYATWWIRQALSRASADQARTIRLPAYVLQQLSQLAKVRREWLQERGREPSIAEMAAELGLASERVQELLLATEHPVSLNTPVGELDEQQLSDFIPDTTTLSSEDRVLRLALNREIQAALRALSEHQRRVIALRFGFVDGRSWTREEVSASLGVSCERTRQIEKAALRRLRSSRPLWLLQDKE